MTAALTRRPLDQSFDKKSPTQLENKLTRLPTTIGSIVIAFLDLKSATSLYQLNKTSALNRVYVESRYPKNLLNLFKKSHLPLNQLPAVPYADDINHTCHNTSPCAVTSLLNEDLSVPVMRFFYKGRPAIALSLQDKSDCRIKGILTLVQALNLSVESTKRWVADWGNGGSNALETLYQRQAKNPIVHEMIDLKVLGEVLAGENRYWEICTPPKAKGCLNLSLEITGLAVLSLANFAATYFANSLTS
ncbi:MAG: hypothetical protein V4487_03340 [Chlamydiota bacterium]